MSIKIIISVIGGILIGYLSNNLNIHVNSDIFIDIGLCVLLLFVGIDIGKNKETLIKIKKIGFKVLLIPFSIILGSIFGSIIGGILIGLPINESGAVGAGLGWYTLSSMMLINYSPELSALAFISNVTREIIAILTIPLIAKHIGFVESIAPAGATAMDTCLPVVSKSTDSTTVVISFITGMVLSFVVPILVPIIINL